MAKISEQAKKWSEGFGREYTERNFQTLEQMEALYKKNFGITRTGLNRRFIDKLDRSLKILEVGANIGNQLLCLKNMGFSNLSGIEINDYAIGIARSRLKDITITKANALELPFKDDAFDLVFTSGVLIHIAPAQINEVLQQIYRCTRKYIWGFEYYADAYTEVEYRDHKALLWKADFAKIYLELFPDLELVKQERLNYIDNDNVDSMFLLAKNYDEIE